MKERLVTLTLRVPAELRKQLKAYAALQERSVQDIVVKLIRRELDKRSKRPS